MFYVLVIPIANIWKKKINNDREDTRVFWCIDKTYCTHLYIRKSLLVIASFNVSYIIFVDERNRLDNISSQHIYRELLSMGKLFSKRLILWLKMSELWLYDVASVQFTVDNRTDQWRGELGFQAVGTMYIILTVRVSPFPTIYQF